MADEKISATQRIELFLERWRDIEQRRVIRESKLKSLNFRVSYTPAGVSYELPDIDEEDWRSFLMTFRQFVLRDEPVFVNKIFDLCYLAIEEGKQKDFLIAMRKEWKRTMKYGGPTSLIDGSKELSTDDIIRVGLYTGYFHNDKERIQLLKSWGEHAPMILGEFTFIVQQLTHIIRHLGHFVERGLDEKWLQIKEEQ